MLFPRQKKSMITSVYGLVILYAFSIMILTLAVIIPPSVGYQILNQRSQFTVVELLDGQEQIRNYWIQFNHLQEF